MMSEQDIQIENSSRMPVLALCVISAIGATWAAVSVGSWHMLALAGALCFGALCLLGKNPRVSKRNVTVGAFAWIVVLVLLVIVFQRFGVRYSAEPVTFGLTVIAIIAWLIAYRGSRHDEASNPLCKEGLMVTVVAWVGFFDQFDLVMLAHAARFMLWAWVGIIAIEGMIRIAVWQRSSSRTTHPLAASFFARRLVGIGATEDQADPIANLFAWGIPRVVVCVVAGLWLSTSLVIVPLDEVALYARLGRYQPQMLEPGFHAVLPYPLGRTVCANVKQVTTLPIGFNVDLKELVELPLLWTRPHGEEPPMLVGNGTEIVVVNGLLRFKVKEDSDSVRSYVTSSDAPSEVLRSLAHRAVFGELNHASMDEILRADRRAMESRIFERVKLLIARHDLGVELIDFGLLSVHPPVEVAPSYLSVVEAAIEAEGIVSQEIIDGQRELLRCRKAASDGIADAQVAREKQLTNVNQEIRRYESWSELYKYAPEIVKKQMFFESLVESVDGKSLVLMGADLPATTKIWIEEAN